MPWKYDPGANRHKHKWNKDYAGFQVEKNVRVGKCPSNLTIETAAELLNTGVPWTNPNISSEYPHYIYNVHNGVIYKAAITVHGVSYHGFPCEGRIPKDVLAQLRNLATERGCLKEFEEWVKQHIIP
ncbi:MAG: hypothetical protein K8F62_00315 [Pseudorhodoplanes sp.]|nr:hypothetical protein [Pseudorhodoplanes sp.]